MTTPPLTKRLAPHAVTLSETLDALDAQQAAHERLIAAGWRWDGFDGYTAPDVAAWEAEQAQPYTPPVVPYWGTDPSDDRRFFVIGSAADRYRKGDRPSVGAYTPEDADPLITPGALRRAIVVGAVVAVACVAIAGWLVVIG